MNKKLCFFLSLAAIATLTGCNKTEINDQPETTQTESINPSEIKSIKPGIWAVYGYNEKEEDKSDFAFFYFRNKAELAADPFYGNFTGAGYYMEPDTMTGLPITYVIDGDDMLMTVGGVDCEIYSKITFENENKFIVVDDAEKTSPELYHENTSRRTVVFLQDMNLQEFEQLYSEEKIKEYVLNYYDSLNDQTSDTVKVLKTDENNDDKYVRTDVSINISTPDNTEDSKFFSTAIVKVGDMEFTVNRFTGILTDKDGNEVDLSKYKTPSNEK